MTQCVLAAEATMLVKNRATGACLSASELSIPGSTAVFSSDCSQSSFWYLPNPGSSVLKHVSTGMCLAYSPVATNAPGNLPLILSPDCEGVAVRFNSVYNGLVQNMLNTQWCLQADGGVAANGVPAVMAPNCLPIITLQFDFEAMVIPSPPPGGLCTICVTLVNFFTPLTTSVPPTVADCNAMAAELNGNVLLNELVPTSPLVFQCTTPPTQTGVDLDVYMQVCAEETVESNSTWVADVDSQSPVYQAALGAALSFDCDVQIVMNSTCSSDTSTYNSACKKKKPPPASRRF
eukprot:363221-Chlamydomonas_euryale.AAC.4